MSPQSLRKILKAAELKASVSVPGSRHREQCPEIRGWRGSVQPGSQVEELTVTPSICSTRERHGDPKSARRLGLTKWRNQIKSCMLAKFTKEVNKGHFFRVQND